MSYISITFALMWKSDEYGLALISVLNDAKKAARDGLANDNTVSDIAVRLNSTGLPR